MSFLSVFRNILHASEVAAQLAAPIVATVDPVVGGLMIQSTDAAVNVEGIITTPGSGEAKAAVVRAGTQATVDAINALLASQSKPPLPTNTTDVVQGTVKNVVLGMNTIQAAVSTPAKV